MILDVQQFFNPYPRSSGATAHAKSVHSASLRRPLAGQVQVLVPEVIPREIWGPAAGANEQLQFGT